MMLIVVFAMCAVIVSVNGAAVGNVGFSAAVSANRNYQTNVIVKFDSVLVNFGNAYNSDTGIFTATKTGLYVFHVHGLALPNTGFWFTLYHNDEPVFKAHGQITNAYSSGGNSIALRVKSGERVYVKTHYPSSVQGDGLNRYTTFTGYLVAVGTSE